jgi:hypothetical protein
MSSKDEKTRIEALGSQGSRKVPHVTKRPRKNRGVPPPATFDIDTLPGSSNLTALGRLRSFGARPEHSSCGGAIRTTH